MPESNLRLNLWPVHLKPKDDELLSSWLVRLAREHGLKLHTFCSLAWPGKQIWNRDIDKSADSEMLNILSAGTGTCIERTRATTLAVYQGILYEKHNCYGPSSWIMPLGIYHRTRRQFGLQFCPLCLAEDKKPYFRRKWRLAFVVTCEKHKILLHDRCPYCGAAVNFHRDEIRIHRKFFTDSLTLCHVCRFDLRRIDGSQIIQVTSVESKFTSMLLQAMDDGYVRLNECVATYSQLYFAGLRQLMKIVAMENKRIAELRRAIGGEFKVAVYTPPSPRLHQDVQEMGIQARRLLLSTVRCLLEEWPYRFIELSRKYRIWSSLWLRHLDPPARAHVLPAPFWLWSVVHDNLYRAKYHPTNEEIKEASRYLRSKGGIVNKSSLAQLLGVKVMPRTRRHNR